MGKNDAGETVIRALRCYKSLDISLIHKVQTDEYREEVLNEILWNEKEAVLIMEARGQDYTLAVSSQAGERQNLAVVKGGFLGSETAGGFVGAYIGMFASGNGIAYDEFASFDWFAYDGRDNG